MWYFQKKGRTEGPIPEATLHLAIEKGEIGALDLLFREGDPRWRSAMEFGELQKYFSKTKPSANEDHWIILSRTKDSKEAKQKGPYRTSEVKLKLKLGDLKYTDYAWKQGMKEWYRITALEIFHGEARAPAPEDLMSQAPEVPSDELLQKVEVLERPKIAPPELRPPEAKGPDLTKKPVPVPTVSAPVPMPVVPPPKVPQVPKHIPISESKPFPKPSKPKEEVKTESQVSAILPDEKPIPEVILEQPKKKKKAPVEARSLSLWDRFQELSPSSKWIVGTLCLVFAIVLAFGSLLFTSYGDHRQLLEQLALKKMLPVQKEIPAPIPVPAPEVVDPPVATQPPPEPEKPKVVPSYLKMKVTADTSEAPIVEMQTDASFHFPITLTVIGEIGDVVGVRSYYRVTRITDIENRKYELRNLGLKPGRYRLEAKIEDIESKATVAVATSNKTFRSDLAAHRKLISYFATNERIQLIKLSERLEAHNQEFITQYRANGQNAAEMKTFLRSWQKKLEVISSQTLKSINPRTRSQYVFAEYWLDLKEMRSEMLKDASKLVQVKAAINSPEWQEYSKVASGVRAFKEKMLAASLFR